MDSSLLTTALENRLLAVLAALSFVLLIVVTLGVVYLTAVEWRDRRKRGQDATMVPTIGKRRKTVSSKRKSKKKT